jgi:hypothetical protein
MTLRSRTVVMLAPVLVGMGWVAACKEKEPPPPAAPSVAPLAKAPQKAPPVDPNASLPPGHPPIGGNTPPRGQAPNDAIHGGKPSMPGMPELPDADAAKDLLDKAPTQFAGITLTPPEGWKAFDAGQGGMAPVAAFVLTKPEGAAGDATARLTHFPGMKRIPLEMNLERWYRQVQQPDGKPTKDVAKQETFEAGGAKVTVVDMSGTIDNKPGQRMIAAAIEHAKGPHFLKVAGPEATVAHWRDSVMTYLKSAATQP